MTMSKFAVSLAAILERLISPWYLDILIFDISQRRTDTARSRYTTQKYQLGRLSVDYQGFFSLAAEASRRQLLKKIIKIRLKIKMLS